MKSKYTFNEIEEFLDKTSKLKISNVYIQDLLTSGKSIGTIKVDDTTYNLLAPSTYAWGEITSKPTNAAGYGITNVVLKQDYINLNDLATQHAQVMGYGNPDGGWRSYSSGILSKVHDSGFALQGLTNTLFFRGISGSVWEDNWHEVLHTGNYASVLGTVYAPYNAAGYLPLSGGSVTGNIVIDGRLFVTAEIISKQHYLFARDNDNADWVVTTKGWTKEYALLHTGNYESIVGNKFLKLSGGELIGRVLISVASQSPLSVKNTAQEWVGLGFAGKNNNGYAFITYNKNEDGSEAWGVTNDGWSKVSELLHSDNYYKYAPKLDGTGATGRWGIGLAAETLTDLNDARHGFLFTMTDNYGTTTGNKPHKSHAAGLTWAIAGNSNYRAQLASASDDGSLYFRMMSYGTWGDWKTLAFTDGSNASGTWGIDITGSAAKLGGHEASHYFRRTDDVISSSAALDAISKTFVGVMTTSNYTPIEGAYSYGQLIQFADKTGTTQIYVADYNGGVWIRNNWLAQTEGFKHEWKQLAYTTSNVASATKLQTARTIWGQSFDGTGDVSGTLYYVNNIYPNSEGERYIGTSSNPFKFMYAEWYGAGAGKTLSFGANNGTHLFVNTSGNVTIGNSDYAGSDYKFFVHGEGRVSGSLSCIGLCGTRPTLGSAPSSGFIVDAYGKNTYGLSVWLENSGQSFIQSGRFDGDATAYALNLQPLGGNVGIGTTAPDEKLHVVGNLHVTGNIIADVEVSAGITIPSGKSITFVDANGNKHVLSGDDTAGGLKIDDKIITVN